MKDWQNNPIVIATLLIILVGAIAVTIIRIKAKTVQVAHPLATQNTSAANEENIVQPQFKDMISRPTRRNPFYHQILFTESKMETKTTGLSKLPANGTGEWPTMPITINGIETIPVGPSQNNETQQPAEEPKLVLNAIVSGVSPLAVIKDGTDQTYFVRSGERFGDGNTVVHVGTSDITVQREGKLLVLKLEGGKDTNEKIQN